MTNEDRKLMEGALENCRLLAARHRKEEWAQHILRFCEEAGVTSNPLRARLAADPVAQEAKPSLVACDNCPSIMGCVEGQCVRAQPDLIPQDKLFVVPQMGNCVTRVSLAQPEPVAWFRYENGDRVYYATKAWDDLQPLFASPSARAPLTDVASIFCVYETDAKGECSEWFWSKKAAELEAKKRGPTWGVSEWLNRVEVERKVRG